MYCHKCGIKLDENARFCHKCGTTCAVLESKCEVDEGKENFNNSYNSIIIIFCLIFLFFLILFAFYYAYKPEKDEIIASNQSEELDTDSYEIAEDIFEADYLPGEENAIGISNANLAGGGFMTSQGDWIYYIFDNKIYKYSEETGSLKVIDGSGTYIGCINVCGDYIYYSQSSVSLSSEPGEICRVRTDGKESEVVVPQIYDYNFLVTDYGKNIYYTGAGNINSSVPNMGYAQYNIETEINEILQIIPNCSIESTTREYTLDTLSIMGFDSITGKIFGRESFAYFQESADNISWYDIKSGEYTRLFDEASGWLIDGPYISDQEILFKRNNNTYVYDVGSKNELYCYDGGLNFAGIVTAWDDYVIYRESGQTWISGYAGKFMLKEAEWVQCILNEYAQMGAVIESWFYYTPPSSSGNMICRVNVNSDEQWEIFAQ